MPEITNDERGRRIFQIQKEKAVETAVEKIRRNLEHDWNQYLMSDLEALKFLLGETWVSIDRRRWEASSFARLAKSELDTIIMLGKAVKRGEKPEQTAINEVIKILNKSSK